MKSRRAQLQGLQLRVLFGGEHDDGDALQLLVLPHDLQHLKAVHHRHHEVQKDDGKLLQMRAHLLQRLLAVLGADHVIVVLQDDAQGIPVDLMVVHDQHKLGPLDLLGSDNIVTTLLSSSDPRIDRLSVS